MNALLPDGSVRDVDAAKALPNEEEGQLQGDARGITEIEKQKCRNFILVFGCKSGTGIGAKSKMAHDFKTALLASYGDDLTCMLDDVLDQLSGTDVNFEIIKSQTARPLKLCYVHNKCDEIWGFIFVQTQLKGFAEWMNYRDYSYHRATELAE